MIIQFRVLFERKAHFEGEVSSEEGPGARLLNGGTRSLDDRSSLHKRFLPLGLAGLATPSSSDQHFLRLSTLHRRAPMHRRKATGIAWFKVSNFQFLLSIFLQILQYEIEFGIGRNNLCKPYLALYFNWCIVPTR